MPTKFEELILIAVGQQTCFSQPPTEAEWKGLLVEAKKQSILGVLLTGVEALPDDQRPPLDVLMAWVGYTNVIVERNKVLDQRAAELTTLLQEHGYLSCVLKGQGVARLYPKPERRQCGDIDAWVATKEGQQVSRKELLEFLQQQGCVMEEVVYHHADVHIFEDAPVELHFVPSYTFNPLRTYQYQRFFDRERMKKCRHLDEALGFAYPTAGFNAVYSLLHIFRHLYHEGIGLRQLMDYYYILQQLTAEERVEAMGILRKMHLSRFTSAIMYVEKKIFQLDDNYLLIEPSKKYGAVVLDEILKAGNFGRYGEHIKTLTDRNPWVRGGAKVLRMTRFLGISPTEVFFAPFWKVWHYFWRKKYN